MARGMLRGAGAAWLGLIVLQTLTQQRGADAVGGLLGAVNNLASRALDPSVPAIPDHSARNTPTVGPDGKPNGGALTPGGQYLPPTDKTIPQPNPIPVVPDSYRIPWPTVPGSTVNA